VVTSDLLSVVVYRQPVLVVVGAVLDVLELRPSTPPEPPSGI
jgi:hypothetical protein